MKLAAALALTLITAPIEAAQTRPVTGLQPLLRINSEIRSPIDPPRPELLLEQRDVYIAKGGFAQITYILGVNTLTPTITRATSSTGELQALNLALIAVRAGVQEDCQIVNGVRGGGYYKFTWYGKGARMNDFQVLIREEALPGVSNCTEEVEDLIQAFFQFERRLKDQPDAEILVPK